MLDQIIKKEKAVLLNKMSCGTVIMDSLNKLSHTEDFFVEIPSGLREMLKSGKASLTNPVKIQVISLQILELKEKQVLKDKQQSFRNQPHKL